MPSEPSTESALPRDPGRRCQGPVSPAVFFYNPFLSLFNPFSSASICEVTRSITPRSYNPMLYSGFEARRSARRSFHKLTSWSLEYQLSALRCIRYLGNPFTGRSESLLEAMLTMGERLSRDYQKPHYGIPEVTPSEGTVSVQERIVKDRPFASLLNFHRDTARRDPKVLVLAPMSGHYATLLRDTVQALLVDHDVYITDWHNARDIPTEHGSFGFDDYVGYIIDFLGKLGPNTHLLAVCQPTVPALVATAYLEQTDRAHSPASLTLMGGPVDTHAAPTEVTTFAEQHSIEWFEKNMIAQVPGRYEGSGRLVYPGFLQLTSFLCMNPEKHTRSHLQLFRDLATDNQERSSKTTKFYDEYLAVCDLPARFYLETVDRVFLRRNLAVGTMYYQGQHIEPMAITRVPLLTVEGANDDISAPGQTLAAHTLCGNLPSEMKYHYLQQEVGHYGVFSGSRWREQIAPRITNFIRKFAVESVSAPLHELPAEMLQQ